METVNNIASAASRAIWGDGTTAEEKKDGVSGNETTGKEPVSGELGDVKSGEPYDKGNIGKDSTTSTTSTTAALPSHPKSTDTATFTELKPADTLPIYPEHETSKTGITSLPNPSSAISSDPPTSRTDTTADPSSAPQNTQNQQGADRPAEAPASQESLRIKETKKEAEDAAKANVTGPGPKSLEDKRGAKGIGGDEDDGPQKKSTGSGTGEKYVRSQGMVADGGDFDAASPGAGKEADRLLEEKGLKHDPAAVTGSKSTETKNPIVEPKTSSEDSSPPAKEKKSLGEKIGLEKIKAKLHKHKD